MAQRKVLILESELLPTVGVHRLLSKLKDVEVTAVEFTNIEALIQNIDAFQPNVLVLDDHNLVETALAYLPLQWRKTIPRIIIIHWEENVIEVYERHLVAIRELTDFLALI